MRILFISSGSLNNPIKGTPLRIYNFLLQISKEHDLLIYAKDVPNNLLSNFVPNIKKSKLSEILYLRKIIKNNNISLLFNTENNIKLAIILKILTGVNLVIDIHGLNYEEQYYNKIGTFYEVKRIFSDLRSKFYLRFYSLIFVVSEKLKNYYIKTNSNIEVVYGGVDDKYFNKKKILRKNKFFVIGYMGNLNHYQGLEFLLDAVCSIKFKNLFKFKLNLVFSGVKDEIIKKLRKRNLIDDVILNFNISHEKTGEIIGGSDVLVISRPSIAITEYAYPSKLSEYLATGIPIITTNVGPVREILDSSLAFIIEPENITYNLEKELLRVYNISSQEKSNLSRNSLNLVKEKLLWSFLGEKINNSLSGIKF